MRRVVVTGLAVTPIGNNMEEYWNGLVTGVNGIAPITRFDTTDFKSKLAAEVKNFDPSAVLDKGTVRKTDLYTQYALVSADEAMQDSGIAGKVAEDELGVYFGSGVGGIETTLENHEGILAGGPKKVSPAVRSEDDYQHCGRPDCHPFQRTRQRYVYVHRLRYRHHRHR